MLCPPDFLAFVVQFGRSTGVLGPLGNAPLHVFAPALGVVFGAIRGLIPG